MTRCRTRLSSFARIAPTALLFVPSLALAAGGGGHHEPSIFDLTWYWVHFLIYVGLLYWMLKDKAPAFWSTRRSAIQRAVEDGRCMLQDASSRLALAETRLAEVQQHVRALIDEIKLETDRESAAILTDAHKRTAALEQQTKTAIEVDRKSAEREIRRQLAQAVIEQAEAKLRSRLSPHTDKPIREAAIEGLGALTR